MPNEFIKFPRTPHLAWFLPEAVRDDHCLSSKEIDQFVASELVIEEKVDGANVGISRTEQSFRVQNRGTFLEKPSHPQFGPLWSWLAQRQSLLLEALGHNLILFGEWCFAVHSLRYDQLPDWFLAFDIYDQAAGRFWSTDRRDSLVRELGIKCVPRIAKGHFTINELQQLLFREKSALWSGLIEGLYLRSESTLWLEGRAKLVRPEFVQQISEHWSTRPIQRNALST